jgi:hypothetical protein
MGMVKRTNRVHPNYLVDVTHRLPPSNIFSNIEIENPIKIANAIIDNTYQSAKSKKKDFNKLINQLKKQRPTVYNNNKNELEQLYNKLVTQITIKYLADRKNELADRENEQDEQDFTRNLFQRNSFGGKNKKMLHNKSRKPNKKNKRRTKKH